MNHFLRLYFDSLTGQCLESLIKTEFYLRIANKRSYSFCSFDRSLLTVHSRIRETLREKGAIILYD